MPTTAHNITDRQITAMAIEAAAAGDLLQNAICELALGDTDWNEPQWLERETDLDADERQWLSTVTVAGARLLCVRAIRSLERRHAREASAHCWKCRAPGGRACAKHAEAPFVAFEAGPGGDFVLVPAPEPAAAAEVESEAGARVHDMRAAFVTRAR